MAKVLQEENRKLRDQLDSVEERLRYEIELNKALVEQAQVIDASLPPNVKNSEYANAYETFEQYNSGYGHVATPPETSEERAGAGNFDRVLIMFYELRAIFEENAIVSSRVQPQADASPLEQLQTVARELQSRSADFADFLSTYVNMLTKKNITEIRPKIKHNLEPYFAEKSDLRQVANKLDSIYEGGLTVKQEDMSTMSSDLHNAVLGVINALIHVLETQQKGGGPF